MDRIKIEQSSLAVFRLVRRECTARGFSRTDFDVLTPDLTLSQAQQVLYALRPSKVKAHGSECFDGWGW